MLPKELRTALCHAVDRVHTRKSLLKSLATRATLVALHVDAKLCRQAPPRDIEIARRLHAVFVELPGNPAFRTS